MRKTGEEQLFIKWRRTSGGHDGRRDEVPPAIFERFRVRVVCLGSRSDLSEMFLDLGSFFLLNRDKHIT